MNQNAMRQDGIAPAGERDVRKNLMLAATIEGGGVVEPVRIRNLSASGAMVDGTYLPRPGARVALRRLNLVVPADTMWTEKGRCGLRFCEGVEIDEWLAGVRRTSRAGGLAQSRVDEVQAALRSGSAEVTQQPASQHPALRDTRDSDRLIGDELREVKRMLDAATAALSDDIDVLLRHEKALQACDIAAATLEILAKVLHADDRAQALDAVEMHEVRSRLTGQATLT